MHLKFKKYWKYQYFNTFNATNMKVELSKFTFSSYYVNLMNRKEIILNQKVSLKFLVTQICSVDSFRIRKLTQKGIEAKSIEAGQKLLINTNTFFHKCIENTQYKYFLKVLKIQIVLNTKGLL